jgi:hypothetical protein
MPAGTAPAIYPVLLSATIPPPLLTLWPSTSRSNIYAVSPKSLSADFLQEQDRLFVPEDEANEISVTIIKIRGGGGKLLTISEIKGKMKQ